VQLLGNRLPIRGAKIRPGRQRPAIVPHGELFDFGQKRFEFLALTRQFFVIPGGSGIGRQYGLVGQIDTRIAGGPVRTQVEIQNLRQQNHAVEVDGAIGLELIDEHRRARRSITLAEQILGGIPAAVFGQKLRNEF